MHDRPLPWLGIMRTKCPLSDKMRLCKCFPHERIYVLINPRESNDYLKQKSRWQNTDHSTSLYFAHM